MEQNDQLLYAVFNWMYLCIARLWLADSIINSIHSLNQGIMSFYFRFLFYFNRLLSRNSILCVEMKSIIIFAIHPSTVSDVFRLCYLIICQNIVRLIVHRMRPILGFFWNTNTVIDLMHFKIEMKSRFIRVLLVQCNGRWCRDGNSW